jgi:phage terminase small subunit
LPELNAKQTRFVAEYLKDQNATQAAIRAGYSPKTAKQIGSRLLTNVDVKAAFTAKQTKLLDKLELTAESLIRNVMDIRDKATTAEAFAPALKAIDMLGNTLPDGNPFEGVTNINATVKDETEHSPLELARGIAFLLSTAQREKDPPSGGLH